MKKLLPVLLFLFSIAFTFTKDVDACEIWDVQAQVLECNDDGFFYVLLDCEFNDVGDSGFRVQGNGNNYGNFTWDQLPVQIGPLEGDGETVYEFVIIDNAIEGCSDWTAIDPVDCNNSGECNIWDVEATPLDCNDDGYFYVLLNFEYQNVGEQGFHVQGNGTNHGNYEYADLPVEIGPLEGDGVTIYEFEAIDNAFEGCSNWTEIDPVNCEGGSSECGIGELQLEVLPCNDAGNFMTIINFEYEGVSEAGFNAYVNNIYLGNYSYSELPVDVGPLEGDGETVYNFFVVDAEYEDCHRWKAIDPVDCFGGGGECGIDELNLEVLPCNEAGNFFTLLNFEYENVSDEGFRVYLNDGLFESYSYEQLPVEIGPLDGDGETSYSFTVSDIVFEDCNSSASIEPVECDGNNSCWMGEMQVNVLPCNNDGQYYVEIDFEHGNTSGDGFKLFVNDDLYGNFNYDELPLEVGPLNGDGVTDYSFFVSDYIYEGCNTYYNMEAISCEEGDGASNIEEDEVLFPNPVISNGLMQFNEQLPDPKDVYIYDLNGNEVFRLKDFAGESFRLPDIKTGMYFYTITVKEVSYKGKFTVK